MIEQIYELDNRATFKYANPEQTAVIVKIDEENISMTVPRGHRFWHQYCIDQAIEQGLVEDFKTEAELLAEKSAEVRAERDRALKESDLEVILAAEKGETPSQAIKDYRQALRDLPAHVDFPNVELPTKPEEV